MLEPSVDPDEWRLEQLRVAPRLGKAAAEVNTSLHGSNRCLYCSPLLLTAALQTIRHTRRLGGNGAFSISMRFPIRSDPTGEEGTGQGYGCFSPPTVFTRLRPLVTCFVYE